MTLNHKIKAECLTNCNIMVVSEAGDGASAKYRKSVHIGIKIR